MTGRCGGLSFRLSVRMGRYRWRLRFPPARRGWLIALAVLLLLIGYVVGAVPTVMALERAGLSSPYLDRAIEVFYAPLIWLDDHVQGCHWFFEAEGRFLTWLFRL